MLNDQQRMENAQGLDNMIDWIHPHYVSLWGNEGYALYLGADSDIHKPAYTGTYEQIERMIQIGKGEDESLRPIKYDDD